jgi:hypothetical protein
MDTDHVDDVLLTKINEAVAAANEAEKTVETAETKFVSRSKTVGLLLLEAKKLHPKVNDFETFLARVDGLKLSRAYDLIRLVGGRTTEEQIRKDTRERVKKHRAKKLPKPTPAPKGPEPISVTSTPVTESPKRKPAEQKTFDSPEEARKQASAHALREFTLACKNWIPRMTVETDRQRAWEICNDLILRRRAA